MYVYYEYKYIPTVLFINYVAAEILFSFVGQTNAPPWYFWIVEITRWMYFIVSFGRHLDI